MPLGTSTSYVGIHNEREFYSDHYLAEFFLRDLRGTLARWRESAGTGGSPDRTPDALLRSLWGEYRSFRADFRRPNPDARRVAVQRTWFRRLLEALGHSWNAGNLILGDGDELPVLGDSAGSGGLRLVILEGYDPEAEGEDPLELKPHAAQFHGEAPAAESLLEQTWAEIVTRRVFADNRPPRWVLILSCGQAVLLERGKWAHNRLLRFDIGEILGRREDSTLKATAALLHRESLVPGAGAALLDGLDQNSHRHAVGVSTDLKYALREAVELLGNEAVRSLRDDFAEASGAGAAAAAQLGLECLRYMYRLLFLLYVEARPELGYAPIDSDAYRKGYSVERLRDMELARLTTGPARESCHIQQSLEQLFRLVREGFEPGRTTTGTLEFDRALHGTFRMRALDSALFNEDRTPLLRRARLTDEVLQRVIRLLSLTRPARGRRARTGRISYGQLGINQLGAVYEALLSFRGFFAQEDLYEVHAAGGSRDELTECWFVPASELGRYSDDERVYERDEQSGKRLAVYRKGTFLYRMTGRDRNKSASYYTPEDLTRTVVKYALRERISDGMRAEEILELTVCEPAMGSAAFLNEAVNQLAEKYLDRRQRELNRRIPQADHAEELQRARHYIADRNVFGIDLNPVAVELAEVSLWLNCIVGDGHVPWFGYQLHAGNSLVGARRQVYRTDEIRTGTRKDERWHVRAPAQVGRSPSAGRPRGTVYHFLLPDPGMANYTDRFVKSLVPESLARLGAWRREFCKPFEGCDARELERLSDAADRLWALHVEQLAADREATEDDIGVWGRDASPRRTANGWKESIRSQGVFGTEARTASPYRRLKLAMDYWCALWFWPLEADVDPPSRDEFISEVGLVLTGDVRGPEAGPGETGYLFGAEYAEHAGDLAGRIASETGVLDVEELFAAFPRLRFVDRQAREHRFFHWDLAFADIFCGSRRNGRAQGGFDLVLGNPPWIKVEWDEGGVLGDFDPLVQLRKLSAPELRQEREGAIRDRPGLRRAYLEEYGSSDGMQRYLNSAQNYPQLKGVQTNLFKCFLPLTWSALHDDGVAGLLHPEGVFDDPKGGALRASLYARLRAHFQFQNERRLFEEVDHHTRFSVNVYGPVRDEARFLHVSNLYATNTVDACFGHGGNGPVPGIRTEAGNWELEGHAKRIVSVGPRELRTFADALDAGGTPGEQARLAAVHSAELMSVMQKFADQSRRLRDLGGNYFCGAMWHETNAQNNGTIRRETRFPDGHEEWILSGPHFFVGNPLSKTPRRECKLNSDYDCIDLTAIPEDYLPRTNYVPACEPEEYRRRIPVVPWGSNAENQDCRNVSSHYRVANRRMIGPASERTLTTAIVQPGPCYVNTVIGTSFSCPLALLDFVGMTHSVPLDAYFKMTGAIEANYSRLKQVPLPEMSKELRSALHVRVLGLNCLTCYFDALWEYSWDAAYAIDRWSRSNELLPDRYYGAEKLPSLPGTIDLGVAV